MNRGTRIVSNLVASICLIAASSTNSQPAFGQAASGSPPSGSTGDAGSPHSMGVSPSQKDLGTWTDINTKARGYYAQWRQRHRDALGPLIMMKGEELTLIRNGVRDSANVIPSDYSMLKSVAHVPLAVFALTKDFTGKPLNKGQIDDLKMWKEVFLAGKADLEKWQGKFSKETYDRQFQMLDFAAEFIDKVVLQKKVSDEELQKYTRWNAKPIAANVDEAIASQLATVDKQVRQWRDRMSDDDWNKTRVVIFGFHMPRKENSASQYFLSLFHQKEEGESVIYVEGPSYEDDAGIDLLATHIIDKAIAIDFFGDRWRMHRDLLSDGARKYLKKHPPKWNRK